MVSSNAAPHFARFLSAHILKNQRFRLLLRFLRQRAKMPVPGSFPCHMPMVRSLLSARPSHRAGRAPVPGGASCTGCPLTHKRDIPPCPPPGPSPPPPTPHHATPPPPPHLPTHHC